MGQGKTQNAYKRNGEFSIPFPGRERAEMAYKYLPLEAIVQVQKKTDHTQARGPGS